MSCAVEHMSGYMDEGIGIMVRVLRVGDCRAGKGARHAAQALEAIGHLLTNTSRIRSKVDISAFQCYQIIIKSDNKQHIKKILHGYSDIAGPECSCRLMEETPTRIPKLINTQAL